jgi:uncharacterized SAM-binding protein YcdF (DUF218 family)
VIYSFSRVAEALAQPIGFVWLLNVLIMIRSLRKREWRAALFFGLVAAALSILGSTSIPSRLLASIERPYLRNSWDDLPVCDAIVMLGGAARFGTNEILQLDLTSAGDRAVTALELLRRAKAPVLVVGGGGYDMKTPPGSGSLEGLLIKQWAARWRIGLTNVIALPGSANTRDEALHSRQLMADRKWKRILLVTSGSHMRRAEATFTSLGIAVVPVICDLRGINSLHDKRIPLVPTVEEFDRLSAYLHELIGWMVYRARGWIETPKAQTSSLPPNRPGAG